MGSLAIVETSSSDPDFYALVGPFALDPRLAADGIARLRDTPGKRWWVATAGGALIGVCAAEPRKGCTMLCSLWVDPAWRARFLVGEGNRLTTAAVALSEARLASLTGALESVANSDVRAWLERNGFRPVRKKGRFWVMRRE